MTTVLDFYATHGFWIWASVAAALLAVEVGVGTGWLLWPSASAAAVAVLALAWDIPWPFAVLIFAALTIATSLGSRRVLRKDLNQGVDINDNALRLIGHRGQAVGAFAAGAGRVFLDGKEWAAQLEDGETLAAGAHVLVTGLDGAKLRVLPEVD